MIGLLLFMMILSSSSTSVKAETGGPYCYCKLYEGKITNKNGHTYYGYFMFTLPEKIPANKITAKDLLLHYSDTIVVYDQVHVLRYPNWQQTIEVSHGRTKVITTSLKAMPTDRSVKISKFEIKGVEILSHQSCLTTGGRRLNDESKYGCPGGDPIVEIDLKLDEIDKLMSKPNLTKNYEVDELTWVHFFSYNSTIKLRDLDLLFAKHSVFNSSGKMIGVNYESLKKEGRQLGIIMILFTSIA